MNHQSGLNRNQPLGLPDVHGGSTNLEGLGVVLEGRGPTLPWRCATWTSTTDHPTGRFSGSRKTGVSSRPQDYINKWLLPEIEILVS